MKFASFSFFVISIAGASTIIGGAIAADPGGCTGGYVDCVNGFAGGQSCVAACEGKCCHGGDEACKNFTGKVCKDGISCSGMSACAYASIPFVVKSCGGEHACFRAGNNGMIGSMFESCRGYMSACEQLAMGGKAGNIKHSCYDWDFSCAGVAINGTIGDMTNSCSGLEACRGLGMLGHEITSDMNNCCISGANKNPPCREAGEDKLESLYCLMAPDVTPGADPGECSAGYVDCVDGFAGGQTCAAACGGKCCTDKDACKLFTGKVCKDGISCTGISSCAYARIPYVVDSCSGQTACNSAGAGGTVGSMFKSCKSPTSPCKMLAQRGKTGNIKNSCNKDKACFQAAALGSIGNLMDSCNEVTACNGLGMGVHAFTSDVRNCCNAPSLCEDTGDFELKEKGCTALAGHPISVPGEDAAWF